MKTFYQLDNVGHAKYTVSFHDGQKTHADGSAFYDLRIFTRRPDLQRFVQELERQGYTRQ